MRARLQCNNGLTIAKPCKVRGGGGAIQRYSVNAKTVPQHVPLPPPPSRSNSRYWGDVAVYLGARLSGAIVGVRRRHRRGRRRQVLPRRQGQVHQVRPDPLMPMAKHCRDKMGKFKMCIK